MFILCCSIALNLHKFEKRWQNYTYFYKSPNFFVSFSHFLSIFPFFLFAFSRILCNFALESIKSSHLRMDSPTEHKHKCHGGQYDAEATFINFKTFQVMQQHIYYIKFALQFADMQIPELVNIFNRLVGNHGWSSMRAYHDQALLDEFQRRSIDTAAVAGRKTISFAHPVRYDQFTNRLVPIS